MTLIRKSKKREINKNLSMFKLMIDLILEYSTVKRLKIGQYFSYRIGITTTATGGNI
jgi:hypothetical protein